MHLEDPQFPPLLKGHAVKAPAKPFAQPAGWRRPASSARAMWCGAATPARAELAIVLEPEVALERALQMAPLMMVALGDCLGSLCPPKVAIQYRWPAASCSTARWPARCASPRRAWRPTPIPAWLVVGAELDIAAPREERQDWSRTSLSEEAGPEITRTDILQSLAAHFLTWLNTWQEEGFRPVHDQWLFRAEGREAPVAVDARRRAASRARCSASTRAPTPAQDARREGAQPRFHRTA